MDGFNYNKKLRNLIGDVRDYKRVLRAMDGVDIVIHAAALKRLDILEYNVEECIKTNIFGSLNVVNACLACNVERAVMVSTDKACDPINTYGACKFVSEKLFTESNYNKGQKKTIFTTVRYGNVLESTGSVIPFFEDKIIEGKKIPLTDSRMTRFIISPEEAVILIFNSLKYCIGGEIFVPKLPAFKITDLIEILKEKHNKSVEIENIGLRPGEKIHELMMNESEIPRSYEYKNFFIITSQIEEYTKIKKKPIYIIEGKKISSENMKFYRSKEAVISKDEVQTLFKSLRLL